MPALHRVPWIGRPGKDPETRFGPNGKKAVHIRLAVSNCWKSKVGQAREYTEWVNGKAWERLGEICQPYRHKGSFI